MSKNSSGVAKSESAEYDAAEARADYIARMAGEGFEPSYPADNELQIDIDSDAQRSVFEESFKIFQREIGETHGIRPKPVVTESRSGFPSCHIRIALPFTVETHERIAWQAALGSDPIRELLSLIRAERGEPNPTLLMERKGNLS